MLGIDFSRAFIDAAIEMKEMGSMPYKAVAEGCLTVCSACIPAMAEEAALSLEACCLGPVVCCNTARGNQRGGPTSSAHELQQSSRTERTCGMQEDRVAHLPEGCDAARTRFRVGDACHLPSNLAPVDAVVAANLICRLPDPMLFLQRLPSLVKPGGIAVLTTPFSWLEAWTPKNKWLGGCALASCKPPIASTSVVRHFAHRRQRVTGCRAAGTHSDGAAIR